MTKHIIESVRKNVQVFKNEKQDEYCPCGCGMKLVNYPRINAEASCFNEGLLSETEGLPSLQA